MVIKLLYLLSIFLNFATSVKLYSSYTNTFCDDEVLYGTPAYISKFREFNQILTNIESGYLLQLYLVAPIHFGCKLSELEIIVVADAETLDREFEDLSDDIRNNIEGEMDVKLILSNDLSEIPTAIRARIQQHPGTNLQVSRYHLRMLLYQIATSLSMRIDQIEFDDLGIQVQIGRNDVARGDQFVLVARAILGHGRNLVRLA